MAESITPNTWHRSLSVALELDPLVEKCKTAGDAAGTALETVQAGLQALSVLVAWLPSTLAGILSAALAALQAVFENLLSNNMHFIAFHNLESNKKSMLEAFAEARQEEAQEQAEEVATAVAAGKVYDENDVLDWLDGTAENIEGLLIGTGLNGWIARLSDSLYDKMDLMRPLGDTETRYQGIVMVWGVPANESPEDLLRTLAELFDFSAWKEMADHWQKSLADDEIFLAKFGPTVLNSDFAREALLQRGAYPDWRAMPLAAFLPPLHDVMGKLRQLAESIMEVYQDLAAVLNDIVSLIDRKIEILQELIDELENLIELLASVLEALTSAYIMWVDTSVGSGGGPAGFISTLSAAENAPDFGDRGIVVGCVAVTTTEKLLDPIKSFLGELREIELPDVET